MDTAAILDLLKQAVVDERQIKISLHAAEEALAEENRLHPIQKAFVDHGAIQCGFCTPGMIMSAKALLDINPSPLEEEIKTGIEGNFCRCTGYLKIVEAIQASAEDMNGNATK